jgi:signal transduction histidine kinase
MRRFPRDARLIVAAAAVLFAGLALLSFLIIAGESRRSRLIMEYEAERMATALAEYARGQGGGLSGIDARVLGFGLYDQSGALVAGYGKAPTFLDSDTARYAFSYDERSRSLVLIRPVGAWGWGGAEKRPMHSMMGRGAGAVYLALDAGDFYRRKAFLRSASFLVPLMVGGLFAAFLGLFASNLRYRKRAEDRETLARLGESARTLAHEVRNPLGAIRIQTALARQRLGGESWPELDAIDEETERLGLLSRRVGEFLKDPAGRPERVDLAVFLEDLARRSPFLPSFSQDGGPAVVLFDPELLRSAVENLLRNARESYAALPTPPPAGEASVELALERGSGRESRRAVISVRDRGAGVPAGAREKVFDPFYTDKIQGSGVGLPLARRFVEATGGSLSLYPREGGGTEARIVLPLAEAT